MFSIRRPQEAKLVEITSGKGEGYIPIYQGFVIRKDDNIPEFTLRRKQEGELMPTLIRLNPTASTSPDNISYESV